MEQLFSISGHKFIFYLFQICKSLVHIDYDWIALLCASDNYCMRELNIEKKIELNLLNFIHLEDSN